jgi:uncharacterized membrane protein YgaE (UPF0421/DUF939 family)
MKIIPVNIDLRTNKTTLADSISMFLSQLLHLAYPYFVTMTAIISMDRTVRLSIDISCNRVIGALIGIIFSIIDQGNPWLAGIEILTIILLNSKLNLTDSITVRRYMFAAIMVHITSDISPFFYVLHRTLDSVFLNDFNRLSR